jgi:hypothetical protein
VLSDWLESQKERTLIYFGRTPKEHRGPIFAIFRNEPSFRRPSKLEMLLLELI